MTDISLELQIQKLTKIYNKEVIALSDFDLTIKPGILGLLGPNGAGKSTLMRILATIINPSKGKVLWNGIDIVKHPNEIRKVLGYLPQTFGVYPKLTVIEFLEYIAAMKGIERKVAKERIQELVEFLNLHHVRNIPLKNYSGGMKQRVGIAQALLNNPRLLIVDEPTTGLDPEERVRFRQLMTDLAGERIVILSTHIVSDVESCANNLAIINEGKLVQYSIPEKITQSVEGKVWRFVVPSNELSDVEAKYQISRSLRVKEGVQVRVIAADSPNPNAEKVEPTLEDAYLYTISEVRKMK